MKRNGAILAFIAALFLGSAGMVVSAPAAAAADVDVIFSDPGAVVGGNVTVNVYTTSEIAGISLTLTYDTSCLSYIGYAGGMGNAAVEDHGGSLSVVDYSSSGSGRFSLNLVFNAKCQGTSVIRAAACSVSSADGDSMNVEFAGHSSTVTIASASTNCDLSGLVISPGTLTPEFSSQTTQYAVSVPYETAVLYMAPYLSDPAASYTVSHNTLEVGLNSIYITVTAGSGAQKVYTLSVTRAQAETPEAPAAVEAPVSAVQTVFAPDGSQMTLCSFTDEQIPAGFQRTELDYHECAVEAAVSVEGTMTVVYCSGNDSNSSGFYQLEPVSGAVTPLNSFTAESATFLILDAALSGEPPAGWVLSSAGLGGREYRAFASEQLPGVYLLYAVNPQGNAGFYVYDAREGTIQRYGILAENEKTVEPTSAPALEEQENVKEILHTKLPLAAACAAALIFLLSTAVLGVLLVNRGRKR